MRLFPALLVLLLAACARPPAETWIHPMLADHPLVGRIYAPKEKTFVTEAEALKRAAAARFLLLGERHDNADHHRLQARIVQAALTADPHRRIAMEMLTPAQGNAAAGFLATRPMDAAGFGAAVGWEKTGWPDWAIYRPIVDQALTFNVPVVPANLDRAEIQSIMKEGYAGLSPQRQQALRLGHPIPDDIRKAIGAEIAESHCRMLPEHALAPFTLIQWARDAAMADAMTDGGGKAILIAGAGHTRLDRAVPLHLLSREHGAAIVSIAFREVTAGMPDPTSVDWPYDLVWFTPRADDVDHCAKFKERMRAPGRPGA